MNYWKARKNEDGEVTIGPRNIKTAPLKKGTTDKVLFSAPSYVAIGKQTVNFLIVIFLDDIPLKGVSDFYADTLLLSSFPVWSKSQETLFFLLL